MHRSCVRSVKGSGARPLHLSQMERTRRGGGGVITLWGIGKLVPLFAEKVPCTEAV